MNHQSTLISEVTTCIGDLAVQSEALPVCGISKFRLRDDHEKKRVLRPSYIRLGKSELAEVLR